MKDSHHDIRQKQNSLKGTERSMIFENTSERKSDGINSATPQEWDRVRKEHPAILREENVYSPSHYTHATGAECIRELKSGPRSHRLSTSGEMVQKKAIRQSRTK